MSDPSADEVRRLRVEEKLSVRQIRARTGLGRNRVHELLRGSAAPGRGDLLVRGIQVETLATSGPRSVHQQ
ncbi:hypothetical protein V6U89_06540 [Micromonospora sp. CPCC 206171]|uniref:hypothetical protein n=1 Tax=Micromonospora sp. CPCC 206171 TaxID=3122405 RepID=UPI002FF037C7